MNRPYMLPHDFKAHEQFNLKALKLLKSEYNLYAKRKFGRIDIKSLESVVFAKVRNNFTHMTTDQSDMLEGLFDAFLGALSVMGHSDPVFNYLESMVKK